MMGPLIGAAAGGGIFLVVIVLCLRRRRKGPSQNPRAEDTNVQYVSKTGMKTWSATAEQFRQDPQLHADVEHASNVSRA